MKPPPQSVYAVIERLVKKFKALAKRERDAINEDNTRKDFILPLFRALEWDIDDMRQVTAEEKISRGYVDFAFRLDGVPRFMLETKRIGENLNDPRWAQQALDYAYHKDVTWAVLSDFEGLKIFNAEIKESNPLAATFKTFTVEDYLPRLNELWLLSRPAFAENALDREAERVFKKSIRTPITQALFDNLTRWRDNLYKNLRAYNRMWSDAEIDGAVQRILDRLIFIRTAEDRAIEGDKLLALVRELQDAKRWNDLIPELARRFRVLDQIYNSQLFAPHLCETLTYEPDTLATIIKELYGSPANYVRYNFAFVDADVLGKAYEQYLGYAVASRKPSGGERAIERAKKAKRKSQGIYYTPTFVVKYIVQQTLGRYLDEHGYNPSRPVRVLDPACGSGSFLIEAFDTLDHFRAQQMGQTRGAYDVRDHARQMEILTQNIFGVDKDAKAVEVAQLNLLLKALYRRDKLPKLANVRCGDSLISGTPAELAKYFGADVAARNPFDWQKEFRAVMADGGFDVIVGNPPYVRIQNLPKDEVDFFSKHYGAATGNYDIYVLFVERALQLLKPGGVIGFILPNKFMQVDYGAGLRKIISENHFVDRIVDFKEFQVFGDATTYTCILFLKKQENPRFEVLSVSQKDTSEPEHIFEAPIVELPAEILAEKAWSLNSGKEKLILEKLTNTPHVQVLEIPSAISRGSSSGADDVFVITLSGTAYKTREGKIIQLEPGILRTPIYATDFGRYRFTPKANERIIFPYDVSKDGYALKSEKDLEHECPNAYQYLNSQRKTLEARKGFQQWFGFSAPRNLHIYESADLLAPLLANRGLYSALPQNKNKYCLMAGGGFSISIGKNSFSPKYILGLLNSSLLFWNLKQISNVFRGGWITCTKQYVGQLPIRRIDFADPAEKRQHDEIVALVEEMLALQRNLTATDELHAERRATLEARIAETDAAIDRAVYRLYHLTDAEIEIVNQM